MAFTHYTPISINSGQVPSTQTDFPVLVSVTDARFKTVGNGGHVQNSNGFDIRPYTSSALTTAITGYELERYNASTGEVVMWVKVSSLSSSTTPIYLAYGDASLTTDGSSATTWSNSFLGVYHLGNGTTLNVNSSTGSNNGTNTNGVTAAAGQIDGCGSFAAASSQYVSLGTGIHPGETTYSAWVKVTSFPNAYNTVLSRDNHGSIYSAISVKSNGKLAPSFQDTGGYRGYDGTGANTLSTGTWYYLVATYDALVNGVRVYVNASFDGGPAASGNLLDTTALEFRIGNDTFTQPWNGQMDEVRIASVARSANWITAEYNNQSAPGTFLTTGTEVALSADVTVNLTGVSAAPAVGLLGFNVSLPLAGVAASPGIGAGTVTIGSVVVTPPDQGLVAGGGHWYGLPEDEKVYLTGVAANPQVGQILALGDIRAVYEKYSAPIPRTEVQKTPEMPAGMRGLFKKVEKPIPPAVFVYQVGLPKLKSAVGTGKVTAHYEELDEETIMLIDLL